jgi:hypothetical protein
MKPQLHHLRRLIIAQVILLLAVVVEGRIFDSSVPSWLREVMMNPRMHVPPQAEEVVLNGLLLLIIVHGLSLLGLWHLWRPARTLYFVTGVLLLLSSLLFADPLVTSGVGTLLGQLSEVLSGVMLALLYFTDLSVYFTVEKASASTSHSQT